MPLHCGADWCHGRCVWSGVALHWLHTRFLISSTCNCLKMCPWRTWCEGVQTHVTSRMTRCCGGGYFIQRDLQGVGDQCRRMHEELKAVGGSARLAGQVALCVGKALHLLAEKAEYMAATGTRPCGCRLQLKAPLHFRMHLLRPFLAHWLRDAPRDDHQGILHVPMCLKKGKLQLRSSAVLGATQKVCQGSLSSAL